MRWPKVAEFSFDFQQAIEAEDKTLYFNKIKPRIEPMFCIRNCGEALKGKIEKALDIEDFQRCNGFHRHKMGSIGGIST
ncbi:MAG: hypothetical protein SGI87_07085 [Flavobacteriales bacterium]|nr:hypothetical protein [Flavobacteriales bacterium]